MRISFLSIASFAASALAVVSFASRGIAHPEGTRVEAYSGQPFGVARVEVPLMGDQAATLSELNGFELASEDNRVLYPALSRGVGARILEGIFGTAFNLGPGVANIYFLFDGDRPFHLTLYAPQKQVIRVRPLPDELAHDSLFREWWQQYQAAARDRRNKGDYPPIVEDYLTSMLSRRVGLPLPDRFAYASGDKASRQALEIMLGAERIRHAVLLDALVSQGVKQQATLPMPEPIAWTPLDLAPLENEPTIEPLAMRVPKECFYVRFGPIRNFLWMYHLLEDYSGDVTRLVMAHGRSDHVTKRVERLLAVRYTVLFELLGEHVAADMALIGQDAMIREGAALGVLFQAKGPLLGVALETERVGAITRHKDHDIKRSTVKIAGRSVSLIASPDNYVRSFHAIDGNFHLVTSSENMVRRFYEAGQGQGALGSTLEFRHARAKLPVERDDTIFVYLSTPFFKGLLSPHYQIEMRRRMRAAAEIEMLQMARLAAQAEGLAAHSVDELVKLGFLPADFGLRPTGGELMERDPQAGARRVLDSLRGARGSFLPVPDMKVSAATPAEVSRFAELAEYHQANWARIEPLMIGVKRTALDDEGLEQIVIDAHVRPFSPLQYGGVPTVLAEPVAEMITPARGDIIHVQARLQGGQLMPHVPTHWLFGGVQDAPPLTRWRSGGLLEAISILRATPGYLAGVPRPGFLDRLPIGLTPPPPDANGYSRMILGLWRRVWGDYSAVSFDRQLLARLPAEATLQPTDEPAQVRWRVGDLSQSQLADWLDRLAWERVRRLSQGNAQLLHVVSRQLGVPRGEALSTTEQLLDTDLICALGGDYKLYAHDDGLVYWMSDKWGQSPREYHAPLLQWFRGANGRLKMIDGELMVHAEYQMQRKKSEKKADLPFMDLFRRGDKKD